MAKTYAERLERVQAAIMAIEDGAQSYMIGGRSMTRASLGELYKQERYLERMASREANGGIRLRGGTPC